MKNTIEQNKITEYFLVNKGVWSKRRDGDLATKLFSQVDVRNDNPSLPFSHIAKKFFLRTVRCAIDRNFVNDSMLIIAGRSVTRKTTFLHSLVGSGELFTFNSSSYAEDEIAYLILATNLFWAMDDLGESRIDHKKLTHWLTMEDIKYRFPYQKKESNLPRTCSIIGACNEIPSKLLSNKRVIPFTLNSMIPTNKTSKINITKFWMQLYNEALDHTVEQLHWTSQELDYFAKLRKA